MNRTLSAAFSSWLLLVAVHAVATKGSGRIAEAMTDLNSIVERVLDADVPAIPDLRAGAAIKPAKRGTPKKAPTSSTTPGSGLLHRMT